MEIYKYLNEKTLVDIIATHPKIITGNDVTIIKEYSLNGGRIDLLLTDRLNKNHYIIVEVKTTANNIRTGIGQVIEYKEKFWKSLKESTTANVECVVCAPCQASFELPLGMKYIDLSENREFLVGIIDILCLKMDMFSEAVKTPINLNAHIRKEEMKMKPADTKEVVNVIKKIDLKNKTKGTIVSIIADKLNVGMNNALGRLNEVERQGYVNFEYPKGHLINVSLTEEGKRM